MNLTQWLLFFIAVQIIHGAGTWKLYQAAGKQAWTAFVPFLNFWVLLKIIQKPWYWFPLVFVPVIQLIMIASIWVETLRYFGKNDYKSILLTLASLGFYFYYISYSEQPQYITNEEQLPQPAFKEWFTSLLFAVVAATFVHNYMMQPFVIPTSSLEKSLLVGDFLLVSKLHYGAKIPQTAVNFPMVHDTIPLLKVKSYLNKPQYPYWRLPGFQSIKNNDIVVFNWPADTVPYFFYRGPLSFIKPVDKKSNYVKRAVGIAGDTLEVRDGYVYINGKKNQLPDRARLQFSYFGKTKGAGLNMRELYEKYDITDPVQYINPEERTFAISAMPEDKHEAFKTHPNIAAIERLVREKGERDPGVFPQDPAYDFNIDQFGPIWIPKRGESLLLNSNNIALYKRIIEVYEGSEMGVNQKVSTNGKTVYINGKAIEKYTFKQDYYWMMGDNRHRSEDSRIWGFVPYSHVVGKPVFIWMSWDSVGKKIRADRVFTTVSGDGERVSYFTYFIIALVLYFIGMYFYNKKKKQHA